MCKTRFDSQGMILNVFWVIIFEDTLNQDKYEIENTLKTIQAGCVFWKERCLWSSNDKSLKYLSPNLT